MATALPLSPVPAGRSAPAGLPAAEGDPRAFGRLVLTGLAGSLAVAVAASLPGSPFSLQRAGAWFFGSAHAGPAVAAFGTALTGPAFAGAGWGRLLDLALGFGGVVLLVDGWLGLGALTRRQVVPVRSLVKVLALWALPLLVAPPVFSTDIYSYAAQAELVSRHLDPYRYGPSTLGATPFVSLTQGVWVNTPSPYGPLILGLDGVLATLAGHQVLATVVLLRLLALAGVAGAAAVLPVIARQHGQDPGAVVALGLLNPLVVLFLIGSGHNDADMAALLLAGIALAGRRRPVLAVVVCALAGAVKDPALGGVVFVAWMWAGPGASWWRRAGRLAAAGGIALVTLEATSLLTGLGWGWLGNLGTPASINSWLAPVSVVASAGSGLSHLLGLFGSASGVLDIVRLAGFVVMAVVCVRLLARSSSDGLVPTLGVALLAVVVLSPVAYPWYLTWGVLPLAVLARGPTRSLVLAVSLLGTVAGLSEAGIGAAWDAGPVPAAILVVIGVALLGLVLVAAREDGRSLLGRRRALALVEGQDTPAPLVVAVD